MELSQIRISEGNLIEINNIVQVNDEWEFKNDDPQILVKFFKPVRGIRLITKVKESYSSDNVVVYFQKKDSSFSENLTVKFKRYFTNENVTDIIFDSSALFARIDLNNRNERCLFESFNILPLYDVPDFTENIKMNIDNNSEQKIMIVTHDLTDTGAPILAFNLARYFKEKGKSVQVLTLHDSKSNLVEKYNALGLVPISLNDFSKLKYDYARNEDFPSFFTEIDSKRHAFWNACRDLGYTSIITNTVVSGAIVKELKEYNFTIISLIHEMGYTISHYNFVNNGKQIADYSDYLVFPDEVVKQDFLEIFKKVYGKSYIRPQGLYLNPNFNEVSEECLNKYSLSKIDSYIMGSGSAEMRKGFDIFVNAAISLCQIYKELKFVWTGEYLNDELKSWFKYQIKKSGLENRILLLPFISDPDLYKTILSRAKAFWLTSREDPFPSVALEAMNYGIPVIGFNQSGGFHTMGTDKKGILIDSFNIMELIDQTKQVLDNTVSIDEKKIKLFCKSLDFKNYANFIYEIVSKGLVIEPPLNLYDYKKSTSTHYYNLQNSCSFEERELALKKAKKIFNRKRASTRDIVLLDTSLGSDNIGDEIIMSACKNIASSIFKDSTIIHIPTHIYDSRIENIQNYTKILCGTNLIYKRMEDSKQMVFPYDMNSFRNVCLLGVGMQQIGIEKTSTDYTYKLLHHMLDNSYIHSVRDEQTKDFLNSIGIYNVINTSCPTMWELTPDKCSNIPIKKAKNVITTITDYAQDPENDTYMLEILLKEYDTVYCWIQGHYDYQYLSNLVDLKKIEVIPPSLSKFDEVIENVDCDYVGTRLHACIRCLNKGRRAVTIVVDNRAKAINHDTNLPIIYRECVKDELSFWINHPEETQIHLPIDAIDKWKNQF